MELATQEARIGKLSLVREGELQHLPINVIRGDGETQSRVSVNPETVQEYAELMRAGTEFPPVRVWFDGAQYWLSDGFQRLAAAKECGHSEIAAEVFDGDLIEARWDSYSANATHGLRRNSADIQLVIRRAVAHPYTSKLSDYQLAQHLCIPRPTVQRWRSRLSSSIELDGVKIANRSGKHYKIQTVTIGRGKHAGKQTVKTLRTLRQELNEMKVAASPFCRRFLNIIGNWIAGRTQAEASLEAIENILLGMGPEHQAERPSSNSVRPTSTPQRRAKASSGR